MLITILIFIVILGVLIFVHEFGHFYVAKKSGMQVEEFGFGFPPRICGLQRVNNRWRVVWGRRQPLHQEQTVYSINLIPLGGFVRILGENNEHEENPKSFINRPFGRRLATLVAGVAMNVILAWAILSVGFGVGLPAAFGSPQDLPKYATLKNSQVAILEVEKGSPAEKAGVSAGDVFLSVDGTPAKNLQQLQSYIESRKGGKFDFKLQRGNKVVDFKVDSLANAAAGEGPTGIVLANVGLLQFPWYLAPFEGAKATINQLGAIMSGLSQLIMGKIGIASLSGPVKIAQLTGQVAHMGFIYLLQFIAFLSLNLAILNILPFPALDGGRVLFLLIEKIRGRKNNQRLEQIVNTMGFFLLLLLMLIVTIKDVKGF